MLNKYTPGIYTSPKSDLAVEILVIEAETETHIEVILNLFNKKYKYVYEYGATYIFKKEIFSKWIKQDVI